MKKHITTSSLTRLALASLSVLACCLSDNLPSALAAPGSWTRKADMPAGVVGGASCEVDGILYVLGGCGESASLPPPKLKSVFAYDPRTEVWTQKQNMPTARHFPAACAVNGIIYVIGGNGVFDPATDVVEAYDPTTDTWMTNKAKLPSPRGLVTVCALDGIIYAIGGRDYATKAPVATVEAYDPATDQWTLKASLLEPSYRGVANAVDGTIYAFFNKSTFAYDPKANQWTRKALIPSWTLNSAGSASGVVDGIVYLFGGLASDDSKSYSDTLAYDPAQDSFAANRLMPLTCEGTNCDSRRAYTACATIGGKIYIAGGLNASPLVEPGGFGYSSTWMFDPQGGAIPQAPGSWTRKANMPTGVVGAGGCEVDGVLYVAGGAGESPSLPPPKLKSVFAYDPKTDVWTPKQNMPTARHFPAACTVNGIIYVIGGNGVFDPPTDVVEAFDPKTDTWMTNKAKLPNPRGLVTVCALDGIIYAIGGRDYATKAPVATVEAYDPATDQWTPKANLPVASYRGVANAVDGIVYAFFNTNIFAYDRKTNQWTLKAQIPSWTLNSAGSASGVVDGIVYLFGGLQYDDSASYSYTLACDQVGTNFAAKRLMPVSCSGTNCDSRRAYAACATIDGKIFIAGGLNASPLVEPSAFSHSSTWMFDPQGGVTPQILSLTCESSNSVRLAWQAEAGRLYGVHSAPDLANDQWTRLMFSTGTNSILATNALTEANCTVPTTNAMRFFRIIEVN